MSALDDEALAGALGAEGREADEAFVGRVRLAMAAETAMRRARRAQRRQAAVLAGAALWLAGAALVLGPGDLFGLVPVMAALLCLGWAVGSAGLTRWG